MSKQAALKCIDYQKFLMCKKMWKYFYYLLFYFDIIKILILIKLVKFN